MASRPVPDEHLIHVINVYNKTGSARATGFQLNIPRSTIRQQLAKAKEFFPHLFDQKHPQLEPTEWVIPPIYVPEKDIKTVLVGGDAHIWPGEPTIMWKAFAKVAKQLKPDCIVLNGDILDGARVSRHGRPLGSKAPKISQEVEAVREHLKMLPLSAHKIWTMGNHDIRVDNYLASAAPELEDYAGRIKDRFPEWEFCWATVINEVEIRHRFRGGIHTAWNNALHSGINIVTSHTHQLQLTAVRNRRGSHYGIECGMLADPWGPQFEYTEGAPNRQCAGFVFLTFDEENNLMPPEFCEMIRGRPAFRNKYVF